MVCGMGGLVRAVHCCVEPTCSSLNSCLENFITRGQCVVSHFEKVKSERMVRSSPKIRAMLMSDGRRELRRCQHLFRVTHRVFLVAVVSRHSLLFTLDCRELNSPTCRHPSRIRLTWRSWIHSPTCQSWHDRKREYNPKKASKLLVLYPLNFLNSDVFCTVANA
jgi:hypothetical protein